MYPVELPGDRIYLREVAVHDARSLLQVVGDPVVCETLIFEPKTFEETREYLADWEIKARAEPRIHYYLAGIVRNTGSLVGAGYLGLIGYNGTDTDVGMLGGALLPSLWRQGFATECAHLLMRFGFETLGLRQIWGSCGPESPVSMSLMKAAGMTYQTTLHQHRVAKGAARDSLVYAITTDEWTALDAART